MTWQEVPSTHTGDDTADSGGSSVDTDAAPLLSSSTSDAAVDSGPVQTYRNPDSAGAVSCTAPNIMCPSTPAAASGDDDDDDDDDDAAPAMGTGPLVCVAAGTDKGNCGSCGHQCKGPDATCIGGQCACSGLHEDYCHDNCVDLDSDDDNCGACDVACDNGQSCTGGACVDDDD